MHFNQAKWPLTPLVQSITQKFNIIFQSTQPEKAQVPPSLANLTHEVSLLGDHAVQPCHGQIKLWVPFTETFFLKAYNLYGFQL